MKIVTTNFFFGFTFALLLSEGAFSQVVINEGSNKNYTTINDENGDYPDWIEIFNTTTDTINLLNYSLTDDAENPTEWAFPNLNLLPLEYKTIYCSGKDRKPISGAINVINTGVYNPNVGWNTHTFATPFYWDGVSNVLINVCAYSSAGYTSNSVFNQSTTTFASTNYSFQDANDAFCYFEYGTPVFQRPNIQLNGFTLGTGGIQNGNQDYPAPYGNWYWGSKTQMLVRGSELSAAGLSAGEISSLAFDVAETDANTFYDYVDINMKMVSIDEVSSNYEIIDPNNNLHTNFKISSDGEMIYLVAPNQEVEDSLFVHCDGLNNSTGSYPDADIEKFLFETPTPSATNNFSNTYLSYALPPSFSVVSGLYDAPFGVTINNPNDFVSTVFYTLDGSDPTENSIEYEDEAINIFYATVLKARVFRNGILGSPTAVASYLLGIDHTTPILSVITDYQNLYGEDGIFDHVDLSWEKEAYVEYFDQEQQLIFSQNAGMQVDGGYGGSRTNPQHSFRIELADPVLGEGSINYPVIPNRAERTKYSKFYLRNGSNQYLGYPYKDACQVEQMAGETNAYYSAWRPITVYINGSYFGLYELREKFDTEYFEELEGANPDSTDILSLSAFNGSVLRAVEGSVDDFYNDYDSFTALNTNTTSYWDLADNYFDLQFYTDYIIAESWMGNVDWPQNNIKIYRSNTTDYRWRFCVIDLELALEFGAWTDCYFDHIDYMLSQDSDNPYINVWLQSLENERYKNYFINRFADVMNTSYKVERLIDIENSFFDQTVLEMPNEYERWGDPFNIPGQMNDFYNRHIDFQFQLSERSSEVRNHIESNFSLPNQLDLTLDVHPAESGTIHISTIEPDTYPWEGVYFNGVPVKIEAIAADGYMFSHWGDNSLISDTLNSVFNDQLNTFQTTFDAYFLIDPNYIRELDLATDFSIFPNPVNDQLQIVNKGNKTDKNLQFQIVDLTGRVVQRGLLEDSTDKTTINVQSLLASVYILKIASAKENIGQFRFVKLAK